MAVLNQLLMAMGIVVVERPGTNQKYENNRKVIKIIVEEKTLWSLFMDGVQLLKARGTLRR